MPADVLERVTKSLEKLEEHMLDIKSLQLKAASETRHASSISELDLALVSAGCLELCASSMGGFSVCFAPDCTRLSNVSHHSPKQGNMHLCTCWGHAGVQGLGRRP
jgi:hypothetical protein